MQRCRIAGGSLVLALVVASCASGGNGDDGIAGDGLPDAGVTGESGTNEAGTADVQTPPGEASLLGDAPVGDGNAACTSPGCSCTPSVGDGGAETVGCWTGPPSMRNVGACHDGTEQCVQTGESAQWGPCQGEQTDCGDASLDAPGCTTGKLTWSWPFTGWPETFTPMLAPNEKLIAVTSITGYACWDQNGDCTACPLLGNDRGQRQIVLHQHRRLRQRQQRHVHVHLRNGNLPLTHRRQEAAKAKRLPGILLVSDSEWHEPPTDGPAGTYCGPDIVCTRTGMHQWTVCCVTNGNPPAYGCAGAHRACETQLDCSKDAECGALRCCIRTATDSGCSGGDWVAGCAADCVGGFHMCVPGACSMQCIVGQSCSADTSSAGLPRVRLRRLQVGHVAARWRCARAGPRFRRRVDRSARRGERVRECRVECSRGVSLGRRGGRGGEGDPRRADAPSSDLARRRDAARPGALVGARRDGRRRHAGRADAGSRFVHLARERDRADPRLGRGPGEGACRDSCEAGGTCGAIARTRGGVIAGTDAVAAVVTPSTRCGRGRERHG